MAQPVVHFEIGGRDSAKTREFYSTMFGWEFQIPEGMDYAMISHSGEGTIGGGVTTAQPGQPPYVTVYVQVDNLKAYLEKVESNGGKMVLPPTPIPGGSEFALFADPDGVVLGLFHPAS